MQDKPDFQQFAQNAGVTFSDVTLLRQAFTHRSYLNEHRNVDWEHNERLEFLGDAVLELIVTDELYHRFPERPEGELTAFRAALVNTSMLATVGDEIGMDDYLLLSRGEARDTGRARQYILANTFEALLGALYLDQGYTVCRNFVHRVLVPRIDEVVEQRLWQDAKSRFQELAQDRADTTPQYETISEEGPDHDKCFTIGVYLGDEQIATGTGKAKQEAEQAAARNAIEAKGWE